MNAGAAVATGDVLLFLHADTRLPADAADTIVAAVQPRPRRLRTGPPASRSATNSATNSAANSAANPLVNPSASTSNEPRAADRRPRWGRFDVRIDGRPRVLRLVAALMNFRSRLTGIATGDQGMFVTRALFDEAGGFPDLPLMEDVALSRRLKSIAGRPACLASRVVTSGRRWEARGPWRTIVLMWRLRFDYWRGVDPRLLARRYAPGSAHGTTPCTAAPAAPLLHRIVHRCAGGCTRRAVACRGHGRRRLRRHHGTDPAGLRQGARARPRQDPARRSDRRRRRRGALRPAGRARPRRRGRRPRGRHRRRGRALVRRRRRHGVGAGARRRCTRR